MDLLHARYGDMLGPGHILIDRAGRMAFGAVRLGLDCRYAADSAHFAFAMSDGSSHDDDRFSAAC